MEYKLISIGHSRDLILIGNNKVRQRLRRHNFNKMP